MIIYIKFWFWILRGKVFMMNAVSYSFKNLLPYKYYFPHINCTQSNIIIINDCTPFLPPPPHFFYPAFWLRHTTHHYCSKKKEEKKERFQSITHPWLSSILPQKNNKSSSRRGRKTNKRNSYSQEKYRRPKI